MCVDRARSILQLSKHIVYDGSIPGCIYRRVWLILVGFELIFDSIRFSIFYHYTSGVLRVLRGKEQVSLSILESINKVMFFFLANL